MRSGNENNSNGISPFGKMQLVSNGKQSLPPSVVKSSMTTHYGTSYLALSSIPKGDVGSSLRHSASSSAQPSSSQH